MKKTAIMTTAIAAICISSPVFADMPKADMDMQMKMMTEYCMKKADMNGDGMLSKAEMTAYGDKMFMSADTNTDAMLSMDEMMTAKSKEHQEMMDWSKDGMKTDSK